jgi:cellulose synthase/poly-beta-1,6-N-acetylglucosamine synthase-like glycosyltransferase
LPHGALTAATVTVAWVLTAIAVVLLLHGSINALLLRRAPAAQIVPGRVSLLLPVRDEEDHVAGCLASLQAQVGVPDLEILVLDDGSTDSTRETALSAASGDSRVRLLTGAALPTGWLGKPHACAQLAGAATGELLVFVDADVRLRPDAVSRTAALMAAQCLDYACPYPRQVAESWLERLVQPLLQWSWLTFLPLRVAERSSRRSLAVGNGQVFAVTSTGYAKSGGHAAVRSAVVEDVALARLLHAAGLHGGFVDGTPLATCRMYGGAAALWRGYTKSLCSAFGSPARAGLVCALLLAVYVVPLTFGGWAAVGAYGAGVASRVVAASRTGGRVVDALAHPLSVVAFAVLVGASVVQRQRGVLLWKGRPL